MKRWGTILGLLLSVALLLVLFSKINLQQFFQAFTLANYFILLPSLLLVALGCYLRALRWRQIVLPLQDISVRSSFVSVLIGALGNILLPGRAGEFIRAHVIGKKAGISRAACFATIVVERLFDGLSILAIFALISFWLKVPLQQTLIFASLITFLAYLALIGAILMFNYKKVMFLKLFFAVVWFLPAGVKERIRQAFESLAAGLTTLNKASQFLLIIFYSFLIWGVSAAGIMVTALAFGYALSFSAALFILVLTTFAVLLPSSPGFVGTFDVAMTYGLVLFGVPYNTALSATLLCHVLGLLPIVALGFYYLWRDKLSLKA